ncbi:MAG: hypothetical protein RLZZ312_1266 [Bacteroidota bacterium]
MKFDLIYLQVLFLFMTKTIMYLYICSLLTILIGCKNEVQIAQLQYPVYNDTIPHIKPFLSEIEPIDDLEFANSKNHLINFANKNWSEKNNVSFLVAKNGQIIFENYQGFSNYETKTQITAQTPMHIASVSKVITATAIMILVDSGRISLDQKVSSILQSFPYVDVSVRDLLSHRSGLRNYAYFTEEKGIWNRKITLTNADILHLLGSKKIKQDCPANRRFTYCNTNYAILALIIEKKVGADFKTAIQKMIFEPLGMKNSFVFDEANDKKSVSRSYKGTNVEVGFDYLDAVYGDKNIYSTPRDLLRFDLARNSAGFLNPDLRKQIFQGYSNERKGIKNYGLGIRMINFENGQNFYFHNGWWHGNTSSYISLQKEKVTIIALSNKYTTLNYRVRNLAKYFGDYPFVIKDSVE